MVFCGGCRALLALSGALSHPVRVQGSLFAPGWGERGETHGRNVLGSGAGQHLLPVKCRLWANENPG